jgi:hypothetical protein
MASNVATGYVCLISTTCADPVKTTLTATHSFFGTTTATYASGAWSFVWNYDYPGFDICPAQNPTGIGVQFSNTGFTPNSPLGWSCDLACPNVGGGFTCSDGASPVVTSFSCPPSFSWSGTISYTIANPSSQRNLYGGLTGPQTFTLTITE